MIKKVRPLDFISLLGQLALLDNLKLWHNLTMAVFKHSQKTPWTSGQSKPYLFNNKIELNWINVAGTDYGQPERAFFQKFETFGLGQTNWAEILWGILGISGQIISTILAQWVPCPSERVAGSLSYKKLWFLGLKNITPKYSQNKILAVKNLWNSVRTSVFGA